MNSLSLTKYEMKVRRVVKMPKTAHTKWKGVVSVCNILASRRFLCEQRV